MQTYFVDAFTNERFKGNPAAVCLTENALSEATMQAIATEIGFSETAFVQRTDSGSYRIRFFTPKQELLLCGHATLASSLILFETTPLESVSYFNAENVELKTGKSGKRIVMEFPVYDTGEIEVPGEMLRALGIDQAIDTRFNPETNIILIEIDGSRRLADLRPDFNALLHSYNGINGVLVTARSGDPDYDFHYRYFWPWAGTNEDPVTGSVQTFLAKYWAARLHKTRMEAFQSSQRTGKMTVELLTDKVRIYGEAVIVFQGEFIN